MKIERRKIDQNQKNRTIRLWVTLMSMAFVLISFIAAGAVKLNQVKINKEDLKTIEEIARDNKDMIGRFDERFTAIDKALKRIEDKID